MVVMSTPHWALSSSSSSTKWSCQDQTEEGTSRCPQPHRLNFKVLKDMYEEVSNVITEEKFEELKRLSRGSAEIFKFLYCASAT